jgi:putative tricarboxylic transport membrane protein
MEEGTRRSGDLWSGVALALLGAYIIVQAWQWDYMSPEGPGPGFFPLWYGIAILVLAALLVVSHVKRVAARRSAMDWRRIARALSTWLALAVSVASFNTLGFVVGFALLTYFIVAMMYRKPRLTAAIVAAASGAGFYLIFDQALGVSLPTGILGF